MHSPSGRGLNWVLRPCHGPAAASSDPAGVQVLRETERSEICLKRAKRSGKLSTNSLVAWEQTWRGSELWGESKTVAGSRARGTQQAGLTVFRRTEGFRPGTIGTIGLQIWGCLCEFMGTFPELPVRLTQL